MTFEIEPMGEVVRLTVTHSELDAVMANNVNGGWPRVLSSFKSLLETGKRSTRGRKRAARREIENFNSPELGHGDFMNSSRGSSFVYVTYIRTTPEKLWEALTDSQFMR